jgi:hypothetical protein
MGSMQSGSRSDSTADADATSVEKPATEAPEARNTYDPAMTDEDEANIPADSEADPNASRDSG